MLHQKPLWHPSNVLSQDVDYHPISIVTMVQILWESIGNCKKFTIAETKGSSRNHIKV